jgi:sulfite exporter TauE/SafE
VELWTALIVGLAGSLHCIGMCGPIAVALPVGKTSRIRHLTGRVAYNSGRILTYAVLGLGAGLIGQTVHVSGYQQVVSIALGVMILMAVILPSRFGALLTGAKLHARLFEPLKRLWSRLFGRGSISALFAVGLLNGFLPCGLVYVALAGAVTTGGLLEGALYMAVFGLGTFPVMLAVSLVGGLLSAGLRSRLRRLIPVGAVVLAMLFVLRGMSLGIPYVSPKIEEHQDGTTEVHKCH